MELVSLQQMTIPKNFMWSNNIIFA